MSADFVYLASASPRRRELLQQIGVSFRLIGAELDETPMAGEAPAVYVSRLALAKADAGWQRSRDLCDARDMHDMHDMHDMRDMRDMRDAPVLAADTAVVLDGRILGKPQDKTDAATMLLELSGRTH